MADPMPVQPAAEPTPAGVQPGSTEETPENLWADLDEDFEDEEEEDVDLGGEPKPAEPPAPVEPPKPETPAEPAPLPETVVEAQPAPEAQPTPEILTGEQPVEVKQPTPEELEQARQQHLGALEQTYQLTKEELEAVEVNPGVVLPKLAANLHLRVAEGVVQTLNAMLPQLIASTVQNLQTQQKAVDSFFSEWKELNKPEYYDTITRIANLYRQTFPDIAQKDRAKFIREVGIQAWSALGLPMEQLLVRGQAQQHSPAPEVPAVSPGFAPASPGAPAAGTAAIRAALRDNPFVQMAEEFMLDDSD